MIEVLEKDFLPFFESPVKISVFMEENRRHFRLREFLDVNWSLADQGISGEGTVVNISMSGLLLQTDRFFAPLENAILSIGSEMENLPFIPKKGKIVWSRQIRAPKERLLCGVEFLNDNSDNSFQEWYQEKVTRLSEAGNANILSNLAF